MSELRNKVIATIKSVFPDVFIPEVEPDHIWLVQNGNHHTFKIPQYIASLDPENAQSYAAEAITHFTYEIVQAHNKEVA